MLFEGLFRRANGLDEQRKVAVNADGALLVESVSGGLGGGGSSAPLGILPAASSLATTKSQRRVVVGVAGATNTTNTLQAADATTSVIGYQSCFFQVVGGIGVTAGTVYPETSADGVNWVPLAYLDLQTNQIGTAPIGVTAASAKAYSCATPFQFFRIGTGTNVNGSGVTVTAEFSQEIWVGLSASGQIVDPLHLATTSVEVPEAGDTAVAAAGNVLARPAVGALINTVAAAPVNTAWVRITPALHTDTISRLETDAANARSLLLYGGNYTIDGTAPAPPFAGTAPNNQWDNEGRFHTGMAFTLTLAQYNALRMLGQGTSVTAGYNQRYKITIDFYAGTVGTNAPRLEAAPLPVLSGGGAASSTAITTWTITTLTAATLALGSAELSANTSRKTVFFYNSDPSKTAYLRFGAVNASSAVGGYHDVVPPGATYRITDGSWTGAIRVFLSSATADMQITQGV